MVFGCVGDASCLLPADALVDAGVGARGMPALDPQRSLNWSVSMNSFAGISGTRGPLLDWFPFDARCAAAQQTAWRRNGVTEPVENQMPADADVRGRSRLAAEVDSGIDAGVVHEHLQRPDGGCCSGDGGLVGDVEDPAR